MEPPNKRAKVDAARSNEGEKFSFWELISTSPTAKSTQQSIANSVGGDEKFTKQTQRATHLESEGPIDVETIVASFYNAKTEQAVRDMLEAHGRTESFIKVLEAQKRVEEEWETRFGDYWTVRGTGNPNYLVLFTGSAPGELVGKGAIVWIATPHKWSLVSFLVTRDVVKPIEKHASWLDCYTPRE